jgi:hypothetical protein
VRRSILLVLLLALCGCGARDAVVKGRSPDAPCPAGTQPVTVRDVVGQPAKGWELWPGDQKELRKYALSFRADMGDAWRGYRSAALIRRGEEVGTAVVVINATTQTPGEALIAGMESGADEVDRDLEEITIAGREGRLVHAIDDSYVAMAPSHQCSILILVSLEEQALRDAAATLPEE